MNAVKKITYRPSWASYWKSWLAIVGILGLFAMSSSIREAVIGPSSQFQNLLPLMALIPATLILIQVLIHRYSRTYEIEENRRIRNTTGVISRARREFLLSDKIQTDLKQSIIGRLLNYGTLRFWTGDEQSGFAWIDVHDPARRETEVKRLVTSQPLPPLSQAEAENSQPPQKTAPKSAGKILQIKTPPPGAAFAEHIVIVPPLPSIIHVVASSPNYISSNSGIEHDHRFIERGEPLISIDIPYRDLLLSSQKFERVTIPSPVTGLIVSHAYELTNEARELRLKNQSEVDPSQLMLTSILPMKDEPAPDDGEVIFADLRLSLWTHRAYLFRDQKLAKHPAKARHMTTFQTDDGVRAMLKELSDLHCERAEAKKYYHEYINETWFKRPDLRPFLRHLVDENGLRKFLEVWKTVPLDQNVDAALRALREDA